MLASRTILGDNAPKPSSMSPEERTIFDKIVPPQYHDYTDVFAEREAEHLPPHRPYDHTIDLEPNTQPPFGPIYSLSETELHALREYLNDNLRKGFIRPSNHQYQPPVLIKDDNLSIFILISIVDKDFPQWGLAEGLDAAWQSLGSPGSPMG